MNQYTVECIDCGARLDTNWFGEPVENRATADPNRCAGCAAERALRVWGASDVAPGVPYRFCPACHAGTPHATGPCTDTPLAMAGDADALARLLDPDAYRLEKKMR